MKKNLLFITSFFLIFCSYSQSSIDFYNKAVLNGEKKNYKVAIDNFNSAINLNPKFVEAYFQRGLLKNRLEDYAGAIADYTSAIEINPNGVY